MENPRFDFTVDVRKLGLLVELDRLGTITATAAFLHLTPSAVSQQLAIFSRDLGVPLLEHRGRGVVLTGPARVLLARAGALREQFELTRVALASWSDGTAGDIRIGALATGISALVAPALESTRRSRPDLKFRVTECDAIDAVAQLDAGDLDITIVSDFPGVPPRNDSRYHRVDLVSDVLDLVLPSDHGLVDSAGIPLADLAGEGWVGAEPGDAYTHIVAAACAAAGFTPDIRHVCREWDAVAALVEAGAGVALIPRLAFPLRHQRVAIRPLLGQGASRLLFALVRAGAQKDAGVAAALDALRIVAAQRGADQPRRAGLARNPRAAMTRASAVKTTGAR